MLQKKTIIAHFLHSTGNPTTTNQRIGVGCARCWSTELQTGRRGAHNPEDYWENRLGEVTTSTILQETPDRSNDTTLLALGLTLGLAAALLRCHPTSTNCNSDDGPADTVSPKKDLLFPRRTCSSHRDSDFVHCFTFFSPPARGDGRHQAPRAAQQPCRFSTCHTQRTSTIIPKSDAVGSKSALAGWLAGYLSQVDRGGGGAAAEWMNERTNARIPHTAIEEQAAETFSRLPDELLWGPKITIYTF